VKYLITILLFIPFAVKAQNLSPFKWLPEDKFYHIMAGSAIGTVSGFAANKPILWATINGNVLGVGKEVYDSKFDVKDAAATIVSSVVCGVIVKLIKKKK